MLLSILLLSASLALAACGAEPASGDAADSASIGAAAQTAGPAPLTEEDRTLYRSAAELAWRYLDDNYQPATGLVSATPDWAYTTTWDIGAQLLGYYAAKELGFIAPAEFDTRMRKTLSTVERLHRYRGVYSRIYSTRDASPGGGNGRGDAGWSAIDLGRMLVALKIIATREPQHAAQVQRIIDRITMREVVRNGYLYGELINQRGKPWRFQEGRIGYEQYAAAGFSAWGADVRYALDIRRNAQTVRVLGVPLLADKRWQDRLVSEPFILMELELGLTPEMRSLAANLLAAQQARYKQTGQVTIASEDAVSVPPHYFYYYCVYCNRKPFVVDAAMPGKDLDAPRWISTKGAFGWHAIMPNDYTKRAVDLVAAGARHPRGWASGVFEGSGKSTRTIDVNTASVLLEIAAFQLRGRRPLIEPPGARVQ